MYMNEFEMSGHFELTFYEGQLPDLKTVLMPGSHWQHGR
jgi:hypothetical protein